MQGATTSTVMAGRELATVLVIDSGRHQMSLSIYDADFLLLQRLPDVFYYEKKL